jgi:hypothetical protein
MKYISKALATCSLVALLASTPALAVETGGAKVKAKGPVTQTVVAKNITNVALGKGAKAGQSIATIHGGAEVGKVTQTVVANSLTNVALGKNAMACQAIGSIGDNPACR